MADIRLEGAGGVTAAVRGLGAELRSLIAGGRELMWQADPAYWGKTSPLLFPAIGFLRGNTAVFDGMSVPLGKHGFARDADFKSERLSAERAVFTLTHSERTRENFPYKFRLTLEYKLLTDGIEMTYTAVNGDVRPMPYCIGAHPAFNCPVEGYKLVFEQPETVNSPVMDAADGLWDGDNRVKRLDNEREFSLAYPLFDNDCVYFDTIRSNSVLLTQDGEHGVSVAWSGFNSLGVWTPAGKNARFVCIEPWRGTNDYKDETGEFANKRDVDILPPGGEKVYTVTIRAVGGE